MTRWSASGLAFVAVFAAACPPPPAKKPIDMQPIGTVPDVPRTPPEDTSGGTTTSPNSGGTSVTKDSGCSGAEVDALDDALKGCEVPMPKNSELPSGIKDKLEVKLVASTTQTSPGGRVDITVTLKNKSNDALPLFFSGDPNPRFDVEATDAKGKRVDVPSGKQPAWPKGTAPPARETKAMRFTLEKGGTARLKLTWDAVKLKWAPQLAKSWEGRGFPREKSGSLPAGKYSLKLVLPLLGSDVVESPKITVDVGS